MTVEESKKRKLTDDVAIKQNEKKIKKDKKVKDKKDKKDKKSKKDKIRTIEVKESSSTPPPAIASRLSARSKWIKQKRASVMDSKALNEIFMVTN